MSLKTKCILDCPDGADGVRLSVMSRHTKNDGETPDERISANSYDAHLTGLAPPRGLIGGYLRQEIGWNEYQEAYLIHLSQPKQMILVHALCWLAKTSEVTLLCIEPTPEMCHRRLLAEFTQNQHQDLTITVR